MNTPTPTRVPLDPDDSLDAEAQPFLWRGERFQNIVLKWWLPFLASAVVIAHMYFLGALAKKLLNGQVPMPIASSVPLLVTFVGAPVVSVTIIIVVALLGVFGKSKRLEDMTVRQLGRIVRLAGGNGTEG